MAGLIANVLDFARGRLGGGFILHRNAECPLEETLGSVVGELRLAWPDRIIETEFHLTPPVHCDHGRLGQLLSNLLGNALAHGAPGAPVVVRAVTSEGQFCLSVANAGDPILPETVEKLFLPFFRGGSGTKNGEGLGLGLYIASEIARAHGGRIDVTSTEAETCFTFTMPMDA